MLHRLHLQHSFERGKLVTVVCASKYITPWWFWFVGRNPTQRCHKHISFSWIENKWNTLVLRFPVIFLLNHAKRFMILLLIRNLNWMVRRRFGWRRFCFLEIDHCDVMDTGSPFILPSWNLPYEILLSMACNLSWRPCRHKIPRDVSPVPLTILLQTQQKLPVVD